MSIIRNHYPMHQEVQLGYIPSALIQAPAWELESEQEADQRVSTNAEDQPNDHRTQGGSVG